MAVEAARPVPPLQVSDHDDPRVVEEAATDDYSLHVVPRTWRMDRVKLTMAWYGVATAFFYMYFAAFIALAYGTTNALIGIVLTVVAYTLVNTDRSYVAHEMDRDPTAGHEAICAACATGRAFHTAASHEAREAAIATGSASR